MSTTELTVIQDVRRTLDKMSGEFRAVLPDHIEPGALIRVAQTAMQLNPDLQACTRQSLLSACTKAAEAGLLPDGEQAALVSYNVKVGERWEKQARFMPMVSGLRDLVRRSGVIKEWKARLVYEGDAFSYVDGDEERLTHEPAFVPGAAIRLVYSIAYDMDGKVQSRNVMRIDEVEAIRRRSRSPDKGPWATDYGEMVKKTCLRRHYKALPRAKDDLQRERIMGAVRALDEAENVIDVSGPIEPAPRLSLIDAARKRMVEAIETSAFDDEPAAQPEQPAQPAQPKQTQTRRRKTADERLAEAEGRAPTGNGRHARGADGQQTPASESTPPREDHSRRGAVLDATSHSSPADDGRDLAYEREAAVELTREPDEDAGQDEPEVEAYRNGWRARFSSQTRVPPRTCTTQEIAQAWFAGYDAAQKVVDLGNAPTNEANSEAMLSRMVDRQFA